MKVVIGARARRDIFILLSVSRDQFGAVAQQRYRALLEQAIADIAENPSRRGVVRLEEVADDDIWLYHARHARPRLPVAHRVGRPRHVIAFRVRQDRLEVIRVLHDAMDLPRRLSEV
ncbi:MAG TPA: type II toxin-antitoxin system RelE/ParE family toxin [Caulobacteraceae bacterium]|nr:type II toxin-antitoxin system RelE/ParE family toxin [Caulobacteraceae bacterium]